MQIFRATEVAPPFPLPSHRAVQKTVMKKYLMLGIFLGRGIYTTLNITFYRRISEFLKSWPLLPNAA
jgi:hypothetical protein